VVYDRSPDPNGPEIPRACEYKDIAILVRSRNLLPAIEQALRDADIPFLVLGGTGFYEEDEVRYLRTLLSFLVDPTDDVSLYVTLRGPFFDIPERDLFLASQRGLSPHGDCTRGEVFFWDRFQSASGAKAADAVAALKDWLARVHKEPLARILSRALEERKVWTKFWEPQREANVRKFLAIVESLEASGEHPLRILNALEQAGADEAKADVRVEDMPGVQILTVHAAKGLQFPVVFLPGLDAPIRSAGSSGDKLVVEETSQDEVEISYIPESGVRREHPLHKAHVEMEYEEEKRIFYVACTRAHDAMFLTGTWNERTLKKTRLEWLVESLGLHETETGFALGSSATANCNLQTADSPAGVYCLTPADIPDSAPPAPVVRDRGPALRRVSPPSSLLPPPSIRGVTRNLASDFLQHGEDGVGIGEVVHKLLEQISNGTLRPRDMTALSDRGRGGQLPGNSDRVPRPLTAEIDRLLRLHGLAPSLSANLQSAITNLQSDVEVWKVIRPQPDSFAELPIMYSDGTTVLTGRIDRVIVTDTEVRIYDYKTFKVAKKDIPELARQYYDGQLKYYEQACSRLYPDRKVSTFLIFTAIPSVVQTEPAGRG
jgi:ATP-dependent exoDNAse (exonuclease V) beta subunit